MPLQQSVEHDERRQLINSNVEDQTSDTKIEDKQCPFTCSWYAFQNKLEKIERNLYMYDVSAFRMMPQLSHDHLCAELSLLCSFSHSVIQ
ncbi:hypothetical protein AB3S75_042188 [Citrus x aurantiifolia]